MKKLILITVIVSTTLQSCDDSSKKKEDTIQQNHNEINENRLSPKQMLDQAYLLFKKGDDKASIELANQVLRTGRITNNDTLIGKALTSLCRNAQRSMDTLKLKELSKQLSNLASYSGDKQWLMYRAHMNAEMWRLVGSMDKAEQFYKESLAISFELGKMGMYTIDHFNMSFVCISKKDFVKAKELIKKYYALRETNGYPPNDAYGLIALAYFLEQQDNLQGAHEVSTVTRRLFKDQNIFPEPPDEKPLLKVEKRVKEKLDTISYNEIINSSDSLTVNYLIHKYL